MSADDYAWLRELEPGEGDAAGLRRLAERLVAKGDAEAAATAYDRAYGLAPDDGELAAARARLLDSLAVVEHGLRFRYVPAGCYAMGSPDGDPDEQPLHLVRLDAFWLTDTPVSWSAYCALLGWQRPPAGQPDPDHPLPTEANAVPADDDGFDRHRFMLNEANKIRLQYCEDATVRASDWHAHAGISVFGWPRRADPRRPERYDRKPMVAVAWQEAELLAEQLSGGAVRYRLPSEAEWEAAARGGLVGARYAWGDAPPTRWNCDFDRFDEFSLQPTRSLPPNGYGLHGMSGGVWEWTADWYDAWYYHESPRHNPTGPGEGLERVLRGGSWADCADVVTVSFRASRDASPWWLGQWSKHLAPNIGFRLCRVRRG